MQSLRSALEPRGALRRKPFIPTQQPPSSLDLAIPPTTVLDNSLARERVSLVHRATLPRRRGSTRTAGAGCVSTSSTGQTDFSASGLVIRSVDEEKEIFGADYKDQLRR